MATRSTLKTAYQILSWSSLAILIVVIFLVLKKSPPPSVPIDPSAAARVQQKFQAADQAKAAGQSPQVQLTPSEVNSYLEQNLDVPGAAAAPAPTASSASPGGQSAGVNSPTGASGITPSEPSLEEVQSSVKDVKVDMDGDLVKAYVIFNLHGQDLSLELDGHLGAQDGYLKFDPVGGKLGSLPLPMSTLTSAVEKMMNSPGNKEKLKLPDGISDIHIQDGQAVVSYK